MRFRQPRLLQAGFTLIEMVVVAGIIGLLSVSIVGTFMGTIKGNQQARTQAEVKTQGDFVIASIERTLRSSTQLPDCTIPGTITFSLPTDSLIHGFRFNTAPNRLQKSDNVAGNVWSDLSGSTVGITGTFTCIADPSSFSGGTVTVQIGVSTLSTGESLSQTFQTSVSIRSTSQ